VESEKVNTHFFSVGQSQIELLESLDPEGVISKYILKKGQGIHHIALKTDDILAEIDRLQALGFEFINPVPKDGADNKKIVFLHPKSTEGVLVELCQDK
jgi:methylmalonyl-CoA/ethylmalonyl-CoA epimerase